MFSMKLLDLARHLGAEIHGNGNIIITGIGSILNAQPGQITYLSDFRLRKKLASCRASAVILKRKDVGFCKITSLIVHDPYFAYAKLAQIMYVVPKPAYNSIGAGVVFASDVVFGKRVSIGANTIINSGVILGDDVSIGSGTVIGKNTKIGIGTFIWSNVTIYHTVEIGKYCVIQSGTVIGSDGFGYANNDHGDWIKIPQLGGVIIGNRVEIGSCTTIDRGALDNTIIGDGVIIDNHCHIAHNVIIGKNTAIAGGVIMAGSLTIGKHCMIGGASVINGHIEICDKVIITGMSMVMKRITKPGIYSSGIPVQPNRIWRKTAALVMNINNISKRIKIIEKKIMKD